MRAFLIIGITVALSGCVDTSSATFQRQTADRCLSFGFVPGSQEMAGCKMQLTMEQEKDNARRKQNVARSLNETADQWQANSQRQLDRNAYIQAHQQPNYVMPIYQPRKTINCVSRPGFGQVTTTCN